LFATPFGQGGNGAGDPICAKDRQTVRVSHRRNIAAYRGLSARGASRLTRRVGSHAGFHIRRGAPAVLTFGFALP
jgi:hypothetical protein